jgi:hypothetical protein
MPNRRSWKAVTAQLTELEEEHGGEDGAFSELEKITAISVKARIKELRSDRSDESDRSEEAALREWLDLNTEIADLKAAIKTAEATLDAAAYAKYSKGSAGVKLDDELLVDERVDVGALGHAGDGGFELVLVHLRANPRGHCLGEVGHAETSCWEEGLHRP